MRTPSLVLASLLAFTTLASADQLADDRAAAASRVYATLASPTKKAAPEEVYRWSVRWLDAQLDAQPKSAAKAFADHAKRMADLETEVKAGYKAGFADSSAVEMAGYYKLEADLWAKRGKK